MIVDFTKMHNNETPWVKVVNKQYDAFFSGGCEHGKDLRPWYDWLENEWNCKLILTSNGKGINGFSMTDEAYVLNLLKFGSPTLFSELG